MQTFALLCIQYTSKESFNVAQLTRCLFRKTCLVIYLCSHVLYSNTYV